MNHPKSLCKAPWTNFQLDVNGAVRPCCKFEQPNEASQYQFPTLKEASISEIWNSETFVQLRKDFIEGKTPDECRACWDEEKAGAKSYRQSMDTRVNLPENFDYHDLKPPAPLALDLKLSNVCNLKCRICGPVASSLWLKEYLEKDDPGDKFLKENRQYFLQNKITRHEQNHADLLEWLPSLQLLELTGGEPLLSQENIELLDICCKHGHARHIELLLVTNSTIYKQPIMELLNSFKKVIINFSIDDIGKRFNYQRYPADWENCNQVISDYMTNWSGNWEFNCHTTVSIYNVYYLPEFIDWFISKGRISHWNLIFNILHYNEEMSINVLPDKVKEQVRRKLNKYRKTLSEPYSYIGRSIDSIIRYMYTDLDKDKQFLWQKFLVKTRKRDAIRAQSFEETVPEFFSLFEEPDQRGGRWQGFRVRAMEILKYIRK